MEKLLCCPNCGSGDLEPHGRHSLLDGRRGRRCLRCGQMLAPRRSRLFLAFAFLLALVVTGVCLAFTARGIRNFKFLSGLVAGPAVMLLSVKAMSARMPVCRPKRGHSAEPLRDL